MQVLGRVLRFIGLCIVALIALALNAWVIFGSARGSPAGAQPPPGSSPLLTCYFVESILVGVKKCDPPSLLVGSVFGACQKEEEEVRQRALNRPPDSMINNRDVAEYALSLIRKEMSARIQKWILDAQTDANGPCHPR